MRERQDAYIRFFSALRDLLHRTDGFPLIDTSPNGASWISVASLPFLGSQLAIFAFSFNQGRQFRVELYIDTYDRERNKYVFDTLFQHREEIEEQVKEKLQWERIDQKRASRVRMVLSQENQHRK